MARYQVDAANEDEAAESLAALPPMSSGDEVALCCSACGTVLARETVPNLVAAEAFRAHACGSVPARVEGCESGDPSTTDPGSSAGGAA